MEVSASGFSTFRQTGISLNLRDALRIDAQLDVSAVQETVEVSAEAVQLQAENATVGQVVNGAQVEALSMNGRNFTFLAQLVQGVNSPQPDTRGNAASGAFSANGFRPAQNNYMLDGIDWRNPRHTFRPERAG